MRTLNHDEIDSVAGGLSLLPPNPAPNSDPRLPDQFRKLTGEERERRTMRLDRR